MILQIEWQDENGNWHMRRAEVQSGEDAHERLCHLTMTTWEDIKRYRKDHP